MPKKEGLEQLLVEELQDLFDAEKQLVRALPKMAKAAADQELGDALREHLEVTRGQVQRLEQVFASMDMRPRGRSCKGMQGLVQEGQEMIQSDMEDAILDSALTGAGRKVEHYEMIGYESARSLAQQLGRRDAAELLQETMQEEMQADRQLAQISRRLLKETSSREKTMARGEASGRQTKSRGSRGSAKSGGRAATRSSGGNKRVLTHPAEIRQWAEERGAVPACVRGTGDAGDIGMLRLDFPGYGSEGSLQPISWEDWAEKFEERGLALIVQDKTAEGENSNFNKLVNRSTVEEKPKVRTAR